MPWVLISFRGLPGLRRGGTDEITLVGMTTVGVGVGFGDGVCNSVTLSKSSCL